MKLTNKQKEEIDFLVGVFCKRRPTQEEIEEFEVQNTHGKIVGVRNDNILIQAKRRLEISSSMWREDLTKGLLGKNELLEDFGKYPYFIRFLNSLLASVTQEYKNKIIGDEGGTILSITNFK